VSRKFRLAISSVDNYSGRLAHLGVCCGQLIQAVARLTAASVLGSISRIYTALVLSADDIIMGGKRGSERSGGSGGKRSKYDHQARRTAPDVLELHQTLTVMFRGRAARVYARLTSLWQNADTRLLQEQREHLVTSVLVDECHNCF
jgi:hypothetical protein